MKLIIDELLPLTKKTEANWRPYLIRHNIEKDTSVLYDNYPQDTANIIVAYILLAYFQKSPWLRMHKDRLENKIEIMTSLLNIKWPVPEPYFSVLENNNPYANEVIEWAIRFQQDWRIQLAETYRTYQSQMRLMGGRIDMDDIQKTINVGKAMDEGRKRREEADAMQIEFDKEYATLNSALHQEGRSSVSDLPSNQITWEQWIAIKNEKKEKPSEETE